MASPLLGTEKCAEHGLTLFEQWLDQTGQVVYGCARCHQEEGCADERCQGQ